MIAMLLACIGAGAACAIPLCWVWQRRRSRMGPLPDLRFEPVVTDALLVRRASVPGGLSGAGVVSVADAASNPGGPSISSAPGGDSNRTPP
jgi:hypothetical protein